MHLTTIYLSLALISVQYVFPVEYIYPITCFDYNNETVVIFMYQSPYRRTQLWMYNIASDSYEQLLSSQYNPTAVHLLPDSTGFSFVDNGYIKVKKFIKRSPTTIEPHEPLESIVPYAG